MKRIPILTVIALLLLGFSSCKNKGGLFIPSDAVAVLHINPSSLSSKISWDEIKKSDWFKEMYQKAADDSLMQKVLDNPEASGMDMKNDLYAFFAQRSRGGYSLFEGSIKDAAAFEAMNKKASKNDKVETGGGYSFITMHNSGLVAWNNTKFAYIHNMPGFAGKNAFGNMRSGSENESLPSDSLFAIAKSVLDNEGKSLYDNDHFKDLIKETGDLHLWFNSSAAMAGMNDAISVMKVSTLVEGNATGMTLNFDDGKISVKSKSFVNKELAALLDKYDSKNISTDLLNRIPSQNVIAVIAASINPLTVKEIIKAAGFDGLINSFVGKEGISLDDIFAALNGQFLFAVSDVHMKDTAYLRPGINGGPSENLKSRGPDANILFATGVANQPTFQKIFNVATEKMGPAPFPYKLTNQWFVTGKNQSSVDGFLSGTQVKQPWADKIAGHPFGMYFNIQKMLLSNLTSDTSSTRFMQESAKVWEDAVATGGSFKNGVGNGEFVINMVDKKTNSLKQLNAYINQASQYHKAQLSRYNRDIQIDTAAMATPPPVK